MLCPPMSTPEFVQWFREAAPYIHAFRGRTFVIAFGGEVISQQAPRPAAVEDLSVAPEGTPAALWSGMTDEQRRAFLVATAKK